MKEWERSGHETEMLELRRRRRRRRTPVRRPGPSTSAEDADDPPTDHLHGNDRDATEDHQSMVVGER